jgi:hypothetical protein
VTAMPSSRRQPSATDRSADAAMRGCARRNLRSVRACRPRDTDTGPAL